MAKRHQNRRQYFDEQAYTTRTFVIPYIQEFKPVRSEMRVLEIGCGEGGNMKPFVDMGCEVIGIDLNTKQLDKAKQFFVDLGCSQNPQLISRDIYKVDPEEIGLFDVIMLRDVIEHIPDQNRFMGHLRHFMKNDGVVFFGFPPWYMPFGGHQQMCKSKLGKLPYMHLLPRTLYKSYLKAVGESDRTVETRLEIYDTGITIERFNRIVRENHFDFLDETLYLFNPNYKIKFGLNPRRQLPLLRSIPWIRNFYTTCCYAIIKKSN